MGSIPNLAESHTWQGDELDALSCMLVRMFILLYVTCPGFNLRPVHAGRGFPLLNPKLSGWMDNGSY